MRVALSIRAVAVPGHVDSLPMHAILSAAAVRLQIARIIMVSPCSLGARTDGCAGF